MPEWVHSLLKLLERISVVPIAFAIVLTGITEAVLREGVIRSPFQNVASAYNEWVVLVIEFAAWFLVAEGGTWIRRRINAKCGEIRQHRRLIKRLHNLTMDEIVLLAQFVLHKRQTRETNFVLRNWSTPAYRLLEDKVIRRRSGGAEYEIVTPAWKYLLTHPELVHVEDKTLLELKKPEPNSWMG